MHSSPSLLYTHNPLTQLGLSECCFRQLVKKVQNFGIINFLLPINFTTFFFPKGKCMLFVKSEDFWSCKEWSLSGEIWQNQHLHCFCSYSPNFPPPQQKAGSWSAPTNVMDSGLDTSQEWKGPEVLSPGAISFSICHSCPLEIEVEAKAEEGRALGRRRHRGCAPESVWRPCPDLNLSDSISLAIKQD